MEQALDSGAVLLVQCEDFFAIGLEAALLTDLSLRVDIIHKGPLTPNSLVLLVVFSRSFVHLSPVQFSVLLSSHG